MVKSDKLIGLCGVLLLIGCDLMEHRTYHDPQLHLQKEDYKNLTHPPQNIKPPLSFYPKASIQKKESLMPEMTKKISVVFHENIPLKRILIEFLNSRKL